MYFNDSQLIVLSTIDLLIVYLFCCLQIFYNSLTYKYIKQAKNKINRTELWRTYLFAMAPIVYSILPILLVLYLYQPSVITNVHFPGIDFALKLVYLHIPPIVIVFGVIIAWNIACSIHNHCHQNFSGLFDQVGFDATEDIKIWDIQTKVVFRKAIYKWFVKMEKDINEAINSNNLCQLLKILEKVEGWYIAKQRFQFFWCTKKRYAWIKKYYYEHYITLIFKIQNAYQSITAKH